MTRRGRRTDRTRHPGLVTVRCPGCGEALMRCLASSPLVIFERQGGRRAAVDTIGHTIAADGRSAVATMRLACACGFSRVTTDVELSALVRGAERVPGRPSSVVV